MKKIILIALVAVLCVGTTYASKLEVSGSAHYRGNYKMNSAVLTTSESLAYYDMEMTIVPKFVIDENTYAIAKLEMRDMTAGKTQGSTDEDDFDDNIWVERAYFGTKIGPTALSVGLMDGGAWGTAFGDSTNGEYRIKAITTTPVGAVVVVVRKALEYENTANNTDDVDVYYLGLVTKAGPLFIKPLVAYARYGNVAVYASDGSTAIASGKKEKTAFLLAVDGKFGAISVEAEFVYENYEYDLGASTVDADYTLMGAFVHVSMAMGDSSAGVMLGYASVDEVTNSSDTASKGFSYGDDAVFSIILDDDLSVGNTEKAGLGGFNLIALYASIKASDSLTITPKIAYAMSNYDDTNNVTTVDSAIELNICSAYKLNDAVTYAFDIAYATISATGSNTDPDDVYYIQHALKIAF
jgi:hypothetical protein